MFFCIVSNMGVEAVPICLGFPNGPGGGASCSGLGFCQTGFYCSNTSVCTTLLPVGTPCKVFDVCASGSDCRGPQGSTLCVAKASPGESCSSTSTVSTPACGTGNCVSNICRGGFVNDTCTSNADCISNICDGKYCVGFPNTLSCLSTYQCAPGLFCKGFTGIVNGTCVPLLTTGVCNPGECAPGYVCEKQSASDQAQCFAYQTRNPGDYCGSSDQLCKGSNRCLNTFCAKSGGDTCSNNNQGQCSVDQTCTCGGQRLNSGTGSCSGTCVNSASEDLRKCMTTNCQSYSNGDYQGSCANRLCKGQMDGFNRCNDGASLTVSFSLVFFFAFLSVFFNKF